MAFLRTPSQWRSQGGGPGGAQAPLLRGCAPLGAPPLKILKTQKKMGVHLRLVVILNIERTKQYEEIFANIEFRSKTAQSKLFRALQKSLLYFFYWNFFDAYCSQSRYRLLIFLVVYLFRQTVILSHVCQCTIMSHWCLLMCQGSKDRYYFA